MSFFLITSHDLVHGHGPSSRPGPSPGPGLNPGPKLVPVLGPGPKLVPVLDPRPGPGQNFWTRHTVSSTQSPATDVTAWQRTGLVEFSLQGN